MAHVDGTARHQSAPGPGFLGGLGGIGFRAIGHKVRFRV